jgi:hypothetical protein
MIFWTSSLARASLTGTSFGPAFVICGKFVVNLNQKAEKEQ